MPNTTIDTADGSLELNGLASFVHLRRPVYLAALYLPQISTSADDILASEQPIVMELAVTAERWSQRSFSTHWSRAFIVNNEMSELQQLDTEVIEFNDVLCSDLQFGDRMRIARDAAGRTHVSINGHELLLIEKPGFFAITLRAWIGNRPPIDRI